MLMRIAGELNGDSGSDVILGDMGFFWGGIGVGTSFGSATNLDNPGNWSVDPNPLFGDDTIPHITVHADPAAGTQLYISLNLVQGQVLTVDIDGGWLDLGSSVSTDTIVTIFNAGQVQVAFDDDSPFTDGGEGSITQFTSGTTRDSYLEYTVPTTGLYYIVVGEFSGDNNFEGDEEFLINISLTGQEVGAPDEQIGNTINGGDGNDLIMGVGGNDILRGDAGDDRILGGTGNDIIEGGIGADELFGESGEDSVFGNGGNDILNLGSRADEGFGGGGNDTIFSGSGNDRVNGGSGNDIIIGGTGNDLLIGGPDNDNIRGDSGDDQIIGGTGIDTANFSTSTGPITADLVSGTASGHGSDTLASIENLIGSGFDDDLRGDGEANFIEGRGGEDSIQGRAGNDTISGGSRADEIFGGVGNDTLMGDAGNDRINGGSGNDDIMGGNDNDLLIGGPGDDTITGGAGIDNMIGGSGDDRFVFADGSGNDSIDGFVAGGTVDVLDYSATAYVFADLNIAAQGNNTLIQTPNGDTVLLLGVAPGDLTMADFLFA
ncbi:calcium-binding protein [Sphingomicrobium clamense]|uniref:Calcium-binding protein n=1 Tax=Sphingomicrobium clamense TaxID=2851013 RepID=A0ABS6V316_9SPHN|nr:calcium-binding protein [Sphingomicrobium sp. B8]MBW0143916.1 hypothetical protein [Sphingomicrobium sp. B8]